MSKIYQPRHKREPSGRTFTHRKDWLALYDTAAWRAHTLKFLKINEKCYACGKESEVVDHLQPHRGDVKLFTKPDNMIPLCHKCHNTVTALFDKRHVEGKSIGPKLTWLKNKRMALDLSFKVMVVPWEGDIGQGVSDF